MLQSKVLAVAAPGWIWSQPTDESRTYDFYEQKTA